MSRLLLLLTSAVSAALVLKFNVTVDTSQWQPCKASFFTPPLTQNTTTQIRSSCDSGPFSWEVVQIPRFALDCSPPRQLPCVQVTYRSAAVLDASPPVCAFYFDEKGTANGCFTMDSREGYHMTSYWFNASVATASQTP